jgi:hypothetical protein
VFLRNLVWFREGIAHDVPEGARHLLESAVREIDLTDVPLVEPFRETIAP